MKGKNNPTIANVTGKIKNDWQLVKATKRQKIDCLNSTWHHENTYLFGAIGGVPYEQLSYQKAKDYLSSLLEKYPEQYSEFKLIDASKYGLPYLAKTSGDEIVETLYFGLEVETYRPFYLPFTGDGQDLYREDIDKNVQIYL